MKVSMVVVTSINGKVTRGDEPHAHAWSSEEDWLHFVSLRDDHPAIIIDRRTFETIKPAPEPGKLRVIVTQYPELFSSAAVPGQLEFSKEEPKELLDRLARQGHDKVLIAGGRADFLSAGLVDDLYVTFEPVLFGTGKPIFIEAINTIRLHVEDVKRLNQGGTVLVHYRVEHRIDAIPQVQ